MRGWVDAFAAMLREAARAPSPEGWRIEAGRSVLAAGMGGSGMAGLLASIHAQSKSQKVSAWRDPQLPAWVGSKEALLLISYSGETWEAEALLEQAIARSVPVRVIASGGRLAERAISERIPLFRVPEGLAPRASLPWLLVGALRALPEWDAAEAERAAAAVERDAGNPAAGRDAARIARDLEGRIPWILPVGSAMEAVALRWRSQILENAEMPCLVSPIPEMAHNEVMTWPSFRRLGLRPAFLVIAEGGPRDPRIAILLEALQAEAREAQHFFELIPPPEGSGLCAMLAQVQLGDRISVELAARLGVAATPVETIRRLRARCRKETDQ